MSFCPNCGFQNEDSAEFCGGCGNRLNGMQSGEILFPYSEKMQATKGKQKNQKRIME